MTVVYIGAELYISLSLWEGPSPQCWTDPPNVGLSPPPPPNDGKNLHKCVCIGCRSARALMVRLERTFSSATVCDQSRCYHAEPELQTLLETSRDPDRLLWAWTGWRRAVGSPMREVYPELIEVLNRGARRAGE